MNETKKPTLRQRLTQAFNYAAIGYFAVQFAGPPVMLDTGEDYLRHKGLDPAIAQTLSDVNIRVTERNTTRGEIFRKSQFLLIFNEPRSSHARRTLTDLVMQRCIVTLNGETLPGSIQRTTATPLEYLTRMPVDTATYQKFVALHEFAHCHSDNKDSDTLTAEADADIRGLRAALQSGAPQSLYPAILYFRALNAFGGASHDTSLSIDAAFNNRPPVPVAAINEAQKSLGTVALRGLFKWCAAHADTDARKFSINHAEIDPRHVPMIVRNHLKNNPAMETHHKRRFQLYLEAVAYFMPEVAAAAPRTPPKDLATRCIPVPP